MESYDRDEYPVETTRLLAENINEEGRGDGVDEPDRGSFVSFILKYKTYDYLIYMAVLTIFLCFPLGILALLFALKAHNDALAGEYGKARRESWMVWATVSLAILIDLLVVVIVLVVKTT